MKGGYILRRLIRRSVSAWSKIGTAVASSELVPVIADIMGAYYQELTEQLAFVQKVILNEEERFHENHWRWGKLIL